MHQSRLSPLLTSLAPGAITVINNSPMMIGDAGRGEAGVCAATVTRNSPGSENVCDIVWGPHFVMY